MWHVERCLLAVVVQKLGGCYDMIMVEAGPGGVSARGEWEARQGVNIGMVDPWSVYDGEVELLQDHCPPGMCAFQRGAAH